MRERERKSARATGKTNKTKMKILLVETKIDEIKKATKNRRKKVERNREKQSEQSLSTEMTFLSPGVLVCVSER